MLHLMVLSSSHNLFQVRSKFWAHWSEASAATDLKLNVKECVFCPIFILGFLVVIKCIGLKDESLIRKMASNSESKSPYKHKGQRPSRSTYYLFRCSYVLYLSPLISLSLCPLFFCCCCCCWLAPTVFLTASLWSWSTPRFYIMGSLF